MRSEVRLYSGAPSSVSCACDVPCLKGTSQWPSMLGLKALSVNAQRMTKRLIGLIKQAWLESGCVYGYRKLHDDLRSLGEACCENRVARLAGIAGIKAQIGYKRKAGFMAASLQLL